MKMRSVLMTLPVTIFWLSVTFLFPMETPNPNKSLDTKLIGDVEWFTEGNSFEEVLALAEKRKLPVMAVFSAVWCGPCQQVKAEVFSKPAFKAMADEAVLLYIEQSKPEGAAWCEKFKIVGYPTFKVFAPEGVQWEEKGFPKRTVQGFLEWIRRVKAGDNLYCMRQNVKKNPKDRRGLVLLAEKEMYVDMNRCMVLLDQVLEMNKDFKDGITQQAMELRALGLSRQLGNLRGPKKIEAKGLARGHLPFIESMIQAYAPDGFCYSLKERWLHVLLDFFNQAGEWARVISIFERYAPSGDSFDWQRDAFVMDKVINAYFHENDAAMAGKWMERLIAHVESLKGKMDLGQAYALKNALVVTVDHQLASDRKAAEQWLSATLKRVGLRGFANFFPFLVEKYAVKEGLATDTFLSLLEEAISRYDEAPMLYVSLAAGIHARKGQNTRALEMILKSATRIHEKSEKDLPSKQKAVWLNHLAWTCVEGKLFDKRTLAIAKEAVRLARTDANLDTLANLHAGLKEYDKAITLETEALGMVKRDYERGLYSGRIAAWKEKRENLKTAE